MIDQEQIRDLMESVRAAEASVEASRRMYDHAAARLAQTICPHRVGDLVEIKGDSYRGKTGLIKAIRIVPYLGRFEWQCDIVVLMANGQESSRRTQFRQHPPQREENNGSASEIKMAATDREVHGEGTAGSATIASYTERGSAAIAGYADT